MKYSKKAGAARLGLILLFLGIISCGTQEEKVSTGQPAAISKDEESPSSQTPAATLSMEEQLKQQKQKSQNNKALMLDLL